MLVILQRGTAAHHDESTPSPRQRHIKPAPPDITLTVKQRKGRRKQVRAEPAPVAKEANIAMAVAANGGEENDFFLTSLIAVH